MNLSCVKHLSNVANDNNLKIFFIVAKIVINEIDETDVSVRFPCARGFAGVLVHMKLGP